MIEASKRGAGRVASDAIREIARLREGGVPKVPEHHGRAQDHSRGVSTVGAHDVLRDVAAARLEERVLLSQFRVLAHENAERTANTQGQNAVLTLPTLQPGTMPGPPTSAAPMLETIAP